MHLIESYTMNRMNTSNIQSQTLSKERTYPILGGHQYTSGTSSGSSQHIQRLDISPQTGSPRSKSSSDNHLEISHFLTYIPQYFFVRFCLFCCFTSQVNSYGHGGTPGTVSSPNHTFSWASLNKQLTSTLCIYFCL